MVNLSFPALLSALLLGDIVVLENGNEIQGEVTEQGKDRIILAFPGGVMALDRREIKEIRRQTRSQYLLEEGDKQLLRGSIEEAIGTFERATKEAPNSARAREGLIRAKEARAAELGDLGRHGESREVLEELSRLDPSRRRTREEIEALDRLIREGGAEEAKGKAEVEEGQTEKGIWRLQRVYDRFPERRKALAGFLAEAVVRRAEEVLTSGEEAAAEVLYLRALTLEPKMAPKVEIPYARLKARAIERILPRGDFEQVAKLAGEGLGVRPTDGPLRYYRALALESRGEKRAAALEYLELADAKRPPKLEDAVQDLRHAAETVLAGATGLVPAPNPRAAEVLGGAFREWRTPHFLILHKNPELARDIAFVSERAYARIFADLRCATEIQTPLRVEVFPTREEYLRASGLGAWSGGSHVVAKALGTLSEHRILSYQGQPCLTSALLPHEIAHALLAHRLNYPARIPLWANEGYAMLQEPDYFQRHRHRVLTEGIARRGWFSLERMLSFETYPANEIDLYYAQSFSLTEFLVSLSGLETFLRFLKNASDAGANVEHEIQRSYRIQGSRALENRWLAWFARESAGAS